MKEFPNGSKNKWTRIFKKKWFFPAVYIAIAAFLLTGVVWYQNTQSKLIEGLDEPGETDEFLPNDFDKEEAESVLQQSETIKMPVNEETQTEIVTKFYDYNKSEEEQEEAVTYYNNRYYQSTGVDIAASDGETFDVVASLSGEVTEVKEDPLYGNVIVMDHDDDITTYYASLEDVDVDTGSKVKQGDTIGTSGQNLFSEENGKHVHFEIKKGETQVNPEEFFNESLAALIDLDVDAEKEEAKEEEQEEADANAEDPDEMEEDSSDLLDDPSDADDPNDADEDESDEDKSDEDEDQDVDEPSDDSEIDKSNLRKDVSFSITA